MKCRRVYVTDRHKVQLLEEELDSALEPTEVLFRTTCSLVSAGTETAIYAQSHRGYAGDVVPDWLQPPVPMGYAAAGVIEKAGAKAWYQEGERVIALTRHADFSKFDTAATQPTSARIPDAVKAEDAVLARLAGISLVGVRRGEVALGHRVAVTGLGLIGNLAGQLARAAGARPVVGCDVVAERVELARQHGLSAFVADDDHGFMSSNGCRADQPEIVLEATGNAQLLPRVLDWVSDGGRVVLLGSPRKPVEIDPYTDLHARRLTLVGAHENQAAFERQWTTARNLDTCLQLIRDGSIDTRGLITHRMRPEQIPEIYQGLCEHPREFMGVILNWE